jgi:ATP-binding cassette, subfamily C (CFTR/MRP), member 1
MPRNRIRKSIVTMQQDPLLLSGTIRSNMDPFSQHSDHAITSALEEVDMLEMVSAKGGLDAQIDAIPFSRGQQQLFCLSRIILSKSRIVVLDEMTSNMDAATEARMMEVVNKKFLGKTIVAVAHHLHTLRNFDKIIVLQQGRIVETGTPDELLQKQSLFKELWERQQ